MWKERAVVYFRGYRLSPGRTDERKPESKIVDLLVGVKSSTSDEILCLLYQLALLLWSNSIHAYAVYIPYNSIHAYAVYIPYNPIHACPVYIPYNSLHACAL
jgi:hypothetical protein